VFHNKTAILLSGGVDSLVAAYLLKKQGHDLIGIHFLTGFESSPSLNQGGTAESWSEIKKRARDTSATLSKQLNIPVVVMDCRLHFKTTVVDYFVKSYSRSKTPSPCLVCNPGIKFGAVFDFARSLDADRLATGHYARTLKDAKGLFHLLTGKDSTKDQSYFLARLSQTHLSRAIFPLGETIKVETVRLAREKGLKPVAPHESQDICFIQNGKYGDFLKQQPGFYSNPGPIKDLNGGVIGEHPGLHLFTIGQRKGINCPAPEAYYVIDMDHDTNTLTVGFKKDTQSTSCRVESINWIGEIPAGPINVKTRVRYRHRAARSRLTPLAEERALIRFKAPQTAITPGQGAVFYDGEEVLGGGFIKK